MMNPTTSRRRNAEASLPTTDEKPLSVQRTEPLNLLGRCVRISPGENVILARPVQRFLDEWEDESDEEFQSKCVQRYQGKSRTRHGIAHRSCPSRHSSTECCTGSGSGSHTYDPD